MKLPSISYLLNQAKASLLRFPLTILSAFLASCLGIYWIEAKDSIVEYIPILNTILTLALGVPLYFLFSVYAEKKSIGVKSIWFLNGIATGILFLLYLSLPNSDSTLNTSVPYIRYGIYNVTIHLIVSFIPFLSTFQLNGFWNYNKSLFLRFLTSILYSGFLYVGLVLALLALKELFDIDLHEELFFELYVVIIGFFNTWFFVTGIPSDFDKLDELKEYPKGLKIFAQYILLSLLTLYLLILYAYVSKIVFLWDWPKGIVAYLIAGVSVLGIFTLLLIYPYGHLEENNWIRKFSRAYYIILIPLVVVLFLAIGMRVDEYGITTNRYAIIALGVWLSIVCVYFSIGKTNIKFIPITLAIILTAVSFGPWGIFSVSERSQANRLKAILENSKILVSGKIKNEAIWVLDSIPKMQTQNENMNEGILSDSLHNEVMSILDYLDSHHGFTSIQSMFKQNVDSIARLHIQNKNGERRYFDEARLYMETMGLEYRYRYMDNSSTEWFTYTANNSEPQIINGYKYLINISENYYDNQPIPSFNLENAEAKIVYSFKNKDPMIFYYAKDTIQLDIYTLIKKRRSEYSVSNSNTLPQKELSIFGTSEHADIRLDIQSINGNSNKDTIDINSLNGQLFIKIK